MESRAKLECQYLMMMIQDEMAKEKEAKQWRNFYQNRCEERVHSMLKAEKNVVYQKNLKPCHQKQFENIMSLRMAKKPIFLISEDFQIEVPCQEESDPSVVAIEGAKAELMEVEQVNKVVEGNVDAAVEVQQEPQPESQILPQPQPGSGGQIQKKDSTEKISKRKIFVEKQCKCCNKIVKKHTCKHTICNKPCLEYQKQQKIKQQKNQKNARNAARSDNSLQLKQDNNKEENKDEEKQDENPQTKLDQAENNENIADEVNYDWVENNLGATNQILDNKVVKSMIVQENIIQQQAVDIADNGDQLNNDRKKQQTEKQNEGDGVNGNEDKYSEQEVVMDVQQ